MQTSGMPSRPCGLDKHCGQVRQGAWFGRQWGWAGRSTEVLPKQAPAPPPAAAAMCFACPGSCS